MGGYTGELIDLLREQYESTDHLGELMLPLANEILAVKICYDRDLLCEELLVRAKIFNRILRAKQEDE